MIELANRAAVLTATGHHGYARFVAAMSEGIEGVTTAAGDAVVWWARNWYGPAAYALGDPAAIPALLPAAPLDSVDHLNLPRGTAHPAGWALGEEWDLLWLVGAVAPHPLASSVVPVDDIGAIEDLLEVAFPDTMMRQADAGHLALGWHGIWRDDTLVACAADRSTRPLAGAAPVGLIGGVATHPAYRGLGLGAAVTSALAMQLASRYDLVALGVEADNEIALHLYARLGFTGTHHNTALVR